MSATALIAYSIAYAINANIIDKEQYAPVVDKAWKALRSVIHNDGKLGWVQPIGADPKRVTHEMTAAYGSGVLLLAGTEIYKLGD